MTGDSPSSLASGSIERLKGVGPTLAGKLAKLGIHTLSDVLFHLPFRYEDRTRITAIGEAEEGQQVVLEGEIVSTEIAFGRRRSLLAKLQDDTGTIGLRFYHFSKTQQRNLENTKRIRCYGEVRIGVTGKEIYHPEYTRSGNDTLPASLTPIYPATEGVSQARYRSIVDQVLALLDNGKIITELLGSDSQYLKQPIDQALVTVHRPAPDCDVDQLMQGTHPSQQRLAFEELLAHNISYRLIREEVIRLAAHPVAVPGERYRGLIDGLDFPLTSAQVRVAEEISADMQRPVPMLRLLQGDVGSGKTVVAAMAAVQAIDSGLQVAIMAPTEILAEQHFINFSNWLSTLGITTAWLSGKIKGKRRNEQLALIESGTAGLVVGTHALFQESVAFRRLGLVIIDEQHRFGVHQRLALREKGESDDVLPHQLVMTATPIPRTLTMSVYADMDASVLDELPPGRTPVATSIIPDARRDEVIDRVRAACAQGAQAYWVCTLIEESDLLQGQAAEATAAQLRETLDDVRVGLVHGRMTPAEKTSVMNDFKQQKIDLLVATTVIEVGVDVPNASLMIIENAERLGLAQLHQLRGRTGRGSRESYCVLMYHPPLGENSKYRLKVMRDTNDGFVIAEEDLKLRGPGELLGRRQSGSVSFRIADLMRDSAMLPEVGRFAGRLFASDRETALAVLSRWISDADRLAGV